MNKGKIGESFQAEASRQKGCPSPTFPTAPFIWTAGHRRPTMIWQGRAAALPILTKAANGRYIRSIRGAYRRLAGLSSSQNGVEYSMSAIAGISERRRDRLIQEHLHDPYKMTRKLPEPNVCPKCGAAFSEGRWQWTDAAPWNATEVSCQACHRTADRYPAGVLTIEGDFAKEHRSEILNLTRHQAALEKHLHPLNRIMAIKENLSAVVVNTTDIHLPRRIGEALRRAYKGELEMRFEKETYFIRVRWRR